MRVTVASDVDDIIFANGIWADFAPFWIVAGGFEGLYGTPPVRETQPVAIPQQDGDYWPSRLTQGGRTVTIKGATFCRSSIEMSEKQQRLSDLIARELRVTVEDEAGRQHVTGYLVEDPETSVYFDRQRLYFTLIIYCPDPLKYGDPVVFSPSGGLLRVENAGRVGSWPSVHVDGGVTALSLSLGSRTVRWSGNANVLDLDLRDMIPSAGVASGQAFRIPPGASIIPVSLSGGGSLSMTVSPAWR
jgi:hypothetical protein